MGLVTGKTAIITGGAAGIGRATALTFAAEGANVVVSDINADGCEETVALIQETGGTAQSITADVSDPAAVSELVAKAVATFGQIDCAVNNAGIEGKITAFTDQPEGNFDAIIAVNLKGTFLCLQAEIAAMLQTGGGTIVNLSSIAGLIGFGGLSPYVASKHGVIGLTKNAALEYAGAGIRVNAICPGGIDTRMLDSLAQQATSGAQSSTELMAPLHPMGRIGAAHDLLTVTDDGAKLTVLRVGKSAQDALTDGDGIDMTEMFARHGLKTTLEHREQLDDSIPAVLNKTAFELGADLIVTGAFGHSRTYDFVLGATTYALLRDQKIPVLFSK